jgi:hypothetical protein
VSFSAKPGERHLNRCQGSTRDISAGGVFIATAELLPMGSILQLDIRLPPDRVRLRTQGRVVRTEAEGFAVAADMGFRMLFQDRMRKATLKVDCREAAALVN